MVAEADAAATAAAAAAAAAAALSSAMAATAKKESLRSEAPARATSREKEQEGQLMTQAAALRKSVKQVEEAQAAERALKQSLKERSEEVEILEASRKTAEGNLARFTMESTKTISELTALNQQLLMEQGDAQKALQTLVDEAKGREQLLSDKAVALEKRIHAIKTRPLVMRAASQLIFSLELEPQNKKIDKPKVRMTSVKEDMGTMTKSPEKADAAKASAATKAVPAVKVKKYHVGCQTNETRRDDDVKVMRQIRGLTEEGVNVLLQRPFVKPLAPQRTPPAGDLALRGLSVASVQEASEAAQLSSLQMLLNSLNSPQRMLTAPESKTAHSPLAPPAALQGLLGVAAPSPTKPLPGQATKDVGTTHHAPHEAHRVSPIARGLAESPASLAVVHVASNRLFHDPPDPTRRELPVFSVTFTVTKQARTITRLAMEGMKQEIKPSVSASVLAAFDDSRPSTAAPEATNVDESGLGPPPSQSQLQLIMVEEVVVLPSIVYMAPHAQHHHHGHDRDRHHRDHGRSSHHGRDTRDKSGPSLPEPKQAVNLLTNAATLPHAADPDGLLPAAKVAGGAVALPEGFDAVWALVEQAVLPAAAPADVVALIAEVRHLRLDLCVDTCYPSSARVSPAPCREPGRDALHRRGVQRGRGHREHAGGPRLAAARGRDAPLQLPAVPRGRARPRRRGARQRRVLPPRHGVFRQRGGDELRRRGGLLGGGVVGATGGHAATRATRHGGAVGDGGGAVDRGLVGHPAQAAGGRGGPRRAPPPPRQPARPPGPRPPGPRARPRQAPQQHVQQQREPREGRPPRFEPRPQSRQ